jgi:multidrug efflux pump subunit AcrB
MLAELAVKRWQLTLVAFLSLIALGASAFVTIPKAEDPTFPIPRFAVVAVLPGASPSDMERQVVDPLEAELYALDDVKDIRTTIEDSLAVIDLEFNAGVDPKRKEDEILRELGALRPTLPSELIRLDLKKFGAARVNIVEYALLSERRTAITSWIAWAERSSAASRPWLASMKWSLWGCPSKRYA